MKPARVLHSSAPGRVCLYGEHQDYLGLPVIPAAIDLRTTLNAHPRKDKVITVKSHDIPESDCFKLDSNIITGTGPYKYLRAVVKVLMTEQLALRPKNGLDITIKSDIPVGAGLSSSAALLTSFTGLLDNYYQIGLSTDEIAEISYIAEHDICGISCGRMDQYSSAIGDLIFLETGERPKYVKLKNNPFPYLVIGDTLERRSADESLSARKTQLQKIRTKLALDNFNTIEIDHVEGSNLTRIEHQRLQSVLAIRNITRKAVEELKKGNPDPVVLGKMLTDQHVQLRDNYNVSSPKLDKLVKVALDRGALGAKLTGAGLSGCIIAGIESMEELERVVDGINNAGGKAIVTKVAEGIESSISPL
ncbi:MAG: galactokinase [Candidatus Hodarchaeales archaeon]